MMRKTVSIAALGVALFLPSVGLAGGNNQNLMHELELLRSKLASQQAHIEALEA